MRIFTLQLLILLSIFQVARAQNDTVYIDCPGVVGGTWTPDNRYIARCNVFVPYDSILTIQPGVKIEFEEGFSFKVEGQLHAVGNGNSRIEIKPYSGSWKGISFGTPSGEEVFNTSLLSYVDIDCGDYTATNEAVVFGKHKINSVNNLRISNTARAIKITGAATIDNITYCNFTNVAQGIIFQYGDLVSHVNIGNCNFENITQQGILVSQNQAFLDNIVISGCNFDNSGLANNQSQSAIYITLNNILTSIQINNNSFDSFALQDNSESCIWIADNAILGLVNLDQNEISNCGGEIPTAPKADYGGLYINESSKVILTNNDFSNNFGKKSGAGYLLAGEIFGTADTFLNNKNNYNGNGNFAGALTIIAGERAELDQDSFTGNVSAKSGGALYIEARSNDNLIDLLFTGITLNSNSAANEGGALLINASLDTLLVSGSDITGNFSAAGSGGCFSIISSEINRISLVLNTIEDNFVSENRDGGFLYLHHDPTIVPSYGAISLNQNTWAVSGHNSISNYNLIYSRIKSFPGTISITGDNVTGCYPVSGYLYHFELLQDGPSAQHQDIHLTLTANELSGNQGPILYVDNDSCTVTAALTGNVVEGNPQTFGTLLTLKCKEATSLSFENEQYHNLVSGTSGGAVSVETVKEIGTVSMQEVISTNCFSSEGDGGHFSFVSGGSNPSSSQEISIINSEFKNQDISSVTGGSGGAIYYHTTLQSDVSKITLDDCNFYILGTQDNGGAIFADAGRIGDVSITGCNFEEISSEDGDGAIRLVAGNGNISMIDIEPGIDQSTTFTHCIGKTNGGALSAEASKEIGSVTINSVVSTGCQVEDGNGGHICLVSLGSDNAMTQDLVITSSIFSNEGVEPTGNDGGAIYYNTKANLNSLSLSDNSFSSFKTFGDGAGLFIEATEINQVGILNSVFISLSSIDAGGGAIFINTTSGDIRNILSNASDFTSCNAKYDGGAFYARAEKEIGAITIDSVTSAKCISSQGNGGHFAFVSGTEDASLAQGLLISNSEFSNNGISSATGGNGGAIYYYSPADPDSLDVRASSFTSLKATGNGGSIYFDTKDADAVNILGTTFSTCTSSDSAGAVYLHARNGNLRKLWIAPFNDVITSFTSCNAGADGGALCAFASKEIGNIIIDSVTVEKCYSTSGNGGHLSLVSLGADGSLAQRLDISGSTFSNTGINNITGANGGMIYYSALSDLASVTVDNTSFKNSHTVKDGGSLFLAAGKIDSFDIINCDFTASASEVMSGGALYVKTVNGLIDGNFTSNRFIDCYSGLMGGSVFIEDGKYDNNTENISWNANLYRIESVTDMPETGGALYCKGINAVSFVSDSAISQSAGGQGGFAYFEKVYTSDFERLYAYGNGAEKGGVIYNNGDAQSPYDQSARIFNSTFLFNNADLTGGCFYITGIDSIEIGKPENKNTFVANQALSTASDEQIGGGVFYVEHAHDLDVNDNSFYVNKSKNFGGIGIVSDISDSLRILNNSLLSNQAKAGGAFAFIDSFAGGAIAWNNFSHNSSDELAGALLFSHSSENSFLIHDNTFFMNQAGRLGGAIASYRPVRLYRNLFRENHLVGINPAGTSKGTTVYLSGIGPQSVIKNCVFDQDYYDEDPVVASVFFDAMVEPFPAVSVANCSFFNYNDQHLSIYSADPDTLIVQNCIFTIRQNQNRDEGVVYFNGTVKSLYSDLIYSLINDPVNHNVDEYIYFNSGDYYFDSTQYPVDQGNPDPSFYDFHFPPAYGELTNDLGISGGPENPDTNSVFLFHEPVNLPTNFDIIVTSKDCFTYTFKCMGEFVPNYSYFYWFMPDSIYRTDEPEFTYTFDSQLDGDHLITALGHDLSNADVYGFGQYNVNLDIIRINSLAVTGYDNNIIPVASVPFTFNIEADIYHENGTPYTWQWTVLDSPGIEYTMTGYEAVCVFQLDKITSLPASVTVKYTLEACNRVLENTITITFQVADIWGEPTLTFYPVQGDIIDSTSFFIMEFDKIMTKANGDLLTDDDIDYYVNLTRPSCPGLIFKKTITYTTSKTIIRFDQVNETTQLPDTLCNGEYKFDVNCDELFTQFYRLNIPDASKSYIVCCNGIEEPADGPFITVYPNPFRDKVHITFTNRDDYYVVVTDLQGQVIKSNRFAGVNEVTLNLETLSDGIYLLRAVNSLGTDHLFVKINKITY